MQSGRVASAQRKKTYRGASSKPNLLQTRHVFRFDNVDFIAVLVAEFVELLNEFFVMFGDQHAPAPFLTRYVGDNRGARGPTPNCRIEPCEPDDIIPDRLPPVHTPRKGKRSSGRTLIPRIIEREHPSRPISNNDTLKHKRPAHLDAVSPVVDELHSDGREGGA